jgi:serine/threonine protein kinase
LALRYITGNKIAHNDIKPRNILLNSQQQVRVCDYGLVAELGPASGEGNAPSAHGCMVCVSLFGVCVMCVGYECMYVSCTTEAKRGTCRYMSP